MPGKSRQRQVRQRLARMEAKRALREHQVARRRRDNLVAGGAIAAAAALAVALQLTVFAAHPTVQEMTLLEEGIEVPSTEPSTGP